MSELRGICAGEVRPNLETARAAMLDELDLVELATLRTRISCDCDELPKVVGAMRPKARATHGHAQVYMPRAHKLAQAEIARRYREARGTIRAGFGGPVMLVVVAHRQLPKGASARDAGEPDIHKPDADNVCKIVADALTGTAWRDDAQVVWMSGAKAPRLTKGGRDWLDIQVTYCERRALL